MKLKLISSLAIAVTLMICLGFYISSDASMKSRFDRLVEQLQNQISSEETKNIKILKEANKNDKNKIRPVTSLDGYINDSDLKDNDLKDNAKYLTKELLSYEEFLDKYTEFDYDPSISKDRMFWVTVTHMPNGVQHKRGFVKNAIQTTVYDAESGEALEYSLKSLDKDGYNLSKN